MHVAGLVDGELPIVATVTRLRTPGIRLAMKDAGSVDLRTDAYVSEDVRTIGDLLSHRDPPRRSLSTKPSSCCSRCRTRSMRRELTECERAAGVRQDADFPGIELASEVNLPKGSGLGTSSILAFAMVHALLDLRRGTAWKPLEGSLAAKVEYLTSGARRAPRDDRGRVA